MGTIITNEAQTAKLKLVTANIQRMAVTNTIVTNFDSFDLQRIFGDSSVDRVLFNANYFKTDITDKVTKSHEDMWKSISSKKCVLLAAIDILNSRSKTDKY